MLSENPKPAKYKWPPERHARVRLARERKLSEQAAKPKPVKTSKWPKVVIVDKDLDLKAVNPSLWERFDDFFVFTEDDRKRKGKNTEEHLYDQFLLDQPKNQGDKVDGYMYTRDELMEAMHGIKHNGNLMDKKERMFFRHKGKGRLCKRDFAMCLAAMGGRYTTWKGGRYWTNVEMKRRPRCVWCPL